MVRICIWMLQIPFEWFEFSFECFESLSNGSTFHWNASNSFGVVWISIQIPRISFECFVSLSNGSNLHSNASNPFRLVRICIRMLWIPFVGLEFAFKRFESRSNVSNLHSNASNPVQMVRFCIRMLRIVSKGSNLHSNASNPFLIVRIWIWTLEFPFEWKALKCQTLGAAVHVIGLVQRREDVITWWLQLTDIPRSRSTDTR